MQDRVLQQRVQAYRQAHDCSNLEAAAEYLRQAHREYQRRKSSVFSRQVARALEALGPQPSAEQRLQALEERHLSRSRSAGDDEVSLPSTSSSCGGAGGSGGSDSVGGIDAEVPADLDDALTQRVIAAATADSGGGGGSGMNSTLQALYSRGVQAAAHQQAEGAAAGLAAAEVGGKGRARSASAAGLPRDRAAPGKRARVAAAPRPSSSITVPRNVRYSDLGGIEAVLRDITELVEYPLAYPEVYRHLGVEPPRGVLLHGPPGCGKTALAHAVATECGVPFLRISAPEIVSGMSGESEARVRQLFQEAQEVAPSIIFIDEIDAIAPKRDSVQREMERRIVAQMLTCMDDLGGTLPGAPADAAPEGALGGGADDTAEPTAAAPHKHVVVIGATNRPDALDSALRRAGRFDREIALGIPSVEARAAILRVLTRPLRLAGEVDFAAVAARTPGFVGADLAALAKEAAALAVRRIFARLDEEADAPERDSRPDAPTANGAGDPSGPAAPPAAGAPPMFARRRRAPLSASDLAGVAITAADFEAAVGRVQPSVRREGFATTPDVTWADVGSLEEVREELAFAVTRPIREPARFAALGLSAPTGVLLYGPPGCGKTLVAKAVANESGANFMSIKGPELLNKYVGESERASSERVVNQLLTEMDGMDARVGVYVVAATNRPDIIDPALLRPGRLDKVLYVPLPPPAGRAEILAALTRCTPLAPDVDLAAVGAGPRTAGFSGADLAALVREAAVASLKEALAAETGPGGAAAAGPPLVQARHFDAALRRVFPSVSRQDQRVYDALRLKLRSTTLQPAPGAVAAPAVPVQPAAPAVDARSEGRSGGGLVLGQGGTPVAGESSSDAMEGAFGSTADEPKPMDE
ncbi:hypothetical protein WJX81_005033 [Elliptochloris bilobata]|uniref:AAA+ ATPase domain-containing protein n=1 Tax=Elliptochloris bilobata TaxID=381761 RepID=A0AAW1QDA4_9CHLO